MPIFCQIVLHRQPYCSSLKTIFQEQGKHSCFCIVNIGSQRSLKIENVDQKTRPVLQMKGQYTFLSFIGLAMYSRALRKADFVKKRAIVSFLNMLRILLFPLFRCGFHCCSKVIQPSYIYTDLDINLLIHIARCCCIYNRETPSPIAQPHAWMLRAYNSRMTVEVEIVTLLNFVSAEVKNLTHIICFQPGKLLKTLCRFKIIKQKMLLKDR